MKKKLENKIALITGGSRGIGRAISIQLASEGAFVAINFASDMAAAKDTLDLIKDRGGDGVLIQQRLSDKASAETLMQKLMEALRAKKLDTGFDILVNSAGVGLFENLSQTTQESFQKVFNVNLAAPFFLTQAAQPYLRDGGRIISLSSGLSKRPQPEVLAYSMTKAAINAFTKGLAKELGPRQITVNSLAPGWTATEANADVLSNDSLRSSVETQTALGRLGTPEDIAKVAVFLSSEDSAWVTGQYLEASGGFGL